MPKSPVKSPSKNLAAGHRSRLRARYLKGGRDALADYELLEMALFATNPRGDTKPLAKALIAHFGTLKKVLNATSLRLLEVEGMGEAALTSILLVRDLASEMLRMEEIELKSLGSWAEVMNYCRVNMSHLDVEEFHVIFLNNKNKVIADEVLNRGTINQTPFYPREVLKRALEVGATALVLAHNHPSGDPTPSKQDVDMTKTLIEITDAVGIQVHDHIIVSPSKCVSLRQLELI